MDSPKVPAALVTLLLVDSLHFVFGRLFAPFLSPFVSAFFVLMIATVQVGLYLAARRQIRLDVLRAHFCFFATIGLLVAAATVLSYTAVTYIDAGTASLLARFSTIITLALSVFWLRERLTRRALFGAALTIGGATLIGSQPGNVFRIGSLILLIGITCYALHIAVVKRYGDDLPFGNFFLYRVGSTAFFLALFMGLSGRAALPADGRLWLLLTLAATVDVVLSRVLYYWLLRRMTLGAHTILLTVSPVVTIGWSFLLFREIPTLRALIGGVIVLIGAVIVARGRVTAPPAAAAVRAGAD